MEHAEQWARERGHACVTLSVFEGNRRAQALYERAVDHLVLPRVLGLFVMMPVLTIYSMFVGIIGGVPSRSGLWQVLQFCW